MGPGDEFRRGDREACGKDDDVKLSSGERAFQHSGDNPTARQSD